MTEKSMPMGESRVALTAVARRDADELAEAERLAARLDRVEFNAWVASFAHDPTLLRTSQPVEVAAMLRVLDAQPSWVEDPELVGRLRAGLTEQLGAGLDMDAVRTSRVLAVDTIRQAQNPGMAEFRLDVLNALDRAYGDVGRDGGSVQVAFAGRLADRGLVVLDAELGEPFEHVPQHAIRPAERPEVPVAHGVVRPGVGW